MNEENDFTLMQFVGYEGLIGFFMAILASGAMQFIPCHDDLFCPYGTAANMEFGAR